MSKRNRSNDMALQPGPSVKRIRIIVNEMSRRIVTISSSSDSDDSELIESLTSRFRRILDGSLSRQLDQWMKQVWIIKILATDTLRIKLLVVTNYEREA